MDRGIHFFRMLASCLILALAIFSLSGVGQQSQPRQERGIPDLLGALKNTPGFLGVETAKTESGKQVLFAWFENKKGVLNWFYSDAHQSLMRMLAPGASSGRKPLNAIADDSGPILVIASLTYADKPRVEGMQVPVSQIAIELYAPLPGGLAVGGRFAPHALKVSGLFGSRTWIGSARKAITAIGS